MPIYEYQNPETGEVIEVIQRMNEEHRYIDENGLEWERIFSIPNASIDTKIDPFSNSSFIDKTKNMKGTVGDLQDQSRELSEKRASAMGEDPIKTSYFDKYSSSRNGIRHHMDTRPQEKRKLKNNSPNNKTNGK